MKAAIYCRTSSKANQNSSSASRQKNAAKTAAEAQHSQVVTTIAEIVSGSLPLDQRGQFTKLMDMGAAKNLDKIFIESTRALARDAPTPWPSSLPHQIQGARRAFTAVMRTRMKRRAAADGYA